MKLVKDVLQQIKKIRKEEDKREGRWRDQDYQVYQKLWEVEF